MNFLAEIIKNPKQVGAIAPSSPQLARLVVAAAELSGDETVLELGPGTGSITKHLVAALDAPEQLIVVDKSKRFTTRLAQEFPNIQVLCGDASMVDEYLKNHERDSVDHVISGLPWANFSDELQRKILRSVTAVLDEDGCFITFAYHPFNRLVRGQNFRENLGDMFSSVEKTRTVLNIPPAFAYICRL